MSYVFMLVSTRPTKEISFFKKNAFIEDYIQKNYINTGKKTIISEPTLDNDLLTETTIIGFKDIDTWNEYLNDPYIIEHLNEKNIHNHNLNIFSTKTVLDQV